MWLYLVGVTTKTFLSVDGLAGAVQLCESLSVNHVLKTLDLAFNR
jgi:hypothetical protein